MTRRDGNDKRSGNDKGDGSDTPPCHSQLDWESREGGTPTVILSGTRYHTVILNGTRYHTVILNGTKWSEESHGDCRDDGILHFVQNDR
jgi:hypothetical protein